MKNKPIIISINGGCIAGVKNVKDQVVIIRDYDVDGSSENLKRDKEGNLYHEIIFKTDW